MQRIGVERVPEVLPDDVIEAPAEVVLIADRRNPGRFELNWELELPTHRHLNVMRQAPRGLSVSAVQEMNVGVG